MDIKYLITDVDGVIFDRMPAYLSAASEVLKPFGFSKDEVRFYFYANLGTPVGIQMKGMLDRSGIDVGSDRLEQMLKEFWAIGGQYRTKLFPGVKETLEKIREQGISIMASSGSNTEEIGRSFKEHDLHYDFYLGSDSVPKGDEHIDIFAEHFSTAKKDFCQRSVFIGDGTTDMQIASRNGIFGVGITNTISAEVLLGAGAQAIISDIGDLLNILRDRKIKIK